MDMGPIVSSTCAVTAFVVTTKDFFATPSSTVGVRGNMRTRLNIVAVGNMGKKTGEGQLLFATGDSFSGIWEEDVLKEGFVSFADGSTYSGHLKDYRFMGFGTYMRPDGTILQGEWDGAVLVKGVEISANGDISEIEENKNYGKGYA